MSVVIMDKNTYVMGWWKNAFRIENAKIAYSYALPELKDEDLIYCQLNRKYKYSNSGGNLVLLILDLDKGSPMKYF